jgi:hypothetical protein
MNHAIWFPRNYSGSNYQERIGETTRSIEMDGFSDLNLFALVARTEIWRRLRANWA